MRSTVMLAYIRLLYDVERETRDHKLIGDERRALRQARSLSILADIRAYLEAEQPKVLPKSPKGQGIAYTLSNWEALVRYYEDGDLAIDNNGAERSLRGILVGRKNGMFYGACKRLRIDPFAYLRDVFARVSNHPRNRLDELLPDRWAARTSLSV